MLTSEGLYKKQVSLDGEDDGEDDEYECYYIAEETDSNVDSNNESFEARFQEQFNKPSTQNVIQISKKYTFDGFYLLLNIGEYTVS
jgi:hypothetical protein